MKVIGLIGGMSWESTVPYYRQINETVKERLGGLHSARVIYEQLCLGKITPESRGEYRRIISELVERGAQAIILGCTEISLLVTQQDSAVPLFDTTSIHARRAAERALLQE